MRQNITNMQTNFSNQIPKVQAQYSKNDNKIIAPNFCNFVKSVLEIVACTSIKFYGAFRRFSISLRNLSTLGTSSLRFDNAKTKIKNFPFLAFRTHWISPMVKCSLHVISGKAERVSTSDDPTIKIPKPFFPDYKLP